MAYEVNMTEGAIEAWTQALLSGEYIQGKEALETHFPDGKVTNCCLGVYCRLAGAKASEGPKRMRNEHIRYAKDIKFQFNTQSFCTTRVSPHVIGIPEEAIDKLIWMNDKGQSFKQIAGWIKRNLIPKKD